MKNVTLLKKKATKYMSKKNTDLALVISCFQIQLLGVLLIACMFRFANLSALKFAWLLYFNLRHQIDLVISLVPYFNPAQTVVLSCFCAIFLLATLLQRYTYRVLQTIQMKVILLQVWAEGAVLGRAKTALKFKYEI